MCSEIMFSYVQNYYSLNEIVPLEQMGEAGLPLEQGSSTRGPRAACGPRASFVWPGKGISQSTVQCVGTLKSGK